MTKNGSRKKLPFLVDTPLQYLLCSRLQHIFNEDAISGSWIINEDMGHCADELAILNNWRAAHADVK